VSRLDLLRQTMSNALKQQNCELMVQHHDETGLREHEAQHLDRVGRR
jgi:hypothetical protein